MSSKSERERRILMALIQTDPIMAALTGSLAIKRKRYAETSVFQKRNKRDEIFRKITEGGDE